MKVPLLYRKVKQEVDVLEHKVGTEGHAGPRSFTQSKKSTQRAIHQANRVEVGEYVFFENLGPYQVVQRNIFLIMFEVQGLFQLSILSFHIRVNR